MLHPPFDLVPSLAELPKYQPRTAEESTKRMGHWKGLTHHLPHQSQGKYGEQPSCEDPLDAALVAINNHPQFPGPWHHLAKETKLYLHSIGDRT